MGKAADADIVIFDKDIAAHSALLYFESNLGWVIKEVTPRDEFGVTITFKNEQQYIERENSFPFKLQDGMEFVINGTGFKCQTIQAQKS